MGRKKNYQTPLQIETNIGNAWFNHYYMTLREVCYQLFEWKNLPLSISPDYLEEKLISVGYVGVTKHKDIGLICVDGAYNGLNIYGKPLMFNYVNPVITGSFPIYNYGGDRDIANGVVVQNTNMSRSLNETILLHAQELAKTHEIMNVNLNAQKTPIALGVSDEKQMLSMKNAYRQYEGNSPFIFYDPDLNLHESVKAITTDAPYIVDKVNQHRIEIMNSFLTTIGINNANTVKKERQITDEVNSNNQGIANFGEIMLSARLKGLQLLKELYPELENVSVDFRVKPELMEKADLGGEED